MGTAVTTFADRPALSPRLQKFVEERGNIAAKETTPSLSITGKTFAISLNGDRQPLMKKDSDGDLVPATTFKAIILDQAPTRGRSYYIKGYNPDTPAMPDCWSDDSVTPSRHATGTPLVDGKRVANCANCPMSVKGSKKFDNGKEGTACGQYQLIALVPAADPDFEPLRLKLAITSVWDGQSPHNDQELWFAFKNYTDWLRANGVHHTTEVITKLKFDPKAEYPKLLFFKDAWTPEDVIDKLVDVIEGPKVKQLLSASWTPNGADGQRTAIAGPQDGPDARAEAARDVTPKQPAGPTPEELAAAAEAQAKVEAAKAAQAKADRVAKAKAEAARLLAEAEAEVEDVATEVVAVVEAKPSQAVSGAIVVTDDDEPALPKATVKATPKATTKKADAPAAKVDATTPSGKNLAELLGKWAS